MKIHLYYSLLLLNPHSVVGFSSQLEVPKTVRCNLVPLKFINSRYWKWPEIVRCAWVSSQSIERWGLKDDRANARSSSPVCRCTGDTHRESGSIHEDCESIRS